MKKRDSVKTFVCHFGRVNRGWRGREASRHPPAMELTYRDVGPKGVDDTWTEAVLLQEFKRLGRDV